MKVGQAQPSPHPSSQGFPQSDCANLRTGLSGFLGSFFTERCPGGNHRAFLICADEARLSELGAREEEQGEGRCLSYCSPGGTTCYTSGPLPLGPLPCSLLSALDSPGENGATKIALVPGVHLPRYCGVGQGSFPRPFQQEGR